MTTSKMPVIGITGYFVTCGELGPRERVRGLPGQDMALFSMDYIRSVDAAGGVPTLLPVVDDSKIELVLQNVDGLLLAGGVDIDPSLYGERSIVELGQVNPDRDRFELALARAALKMDKPILGICRGMQILNVALGGSLYQDLRSQRPGGAQHACLQYPKWHSTHVVHLESHGKLSKVFGTIDLAVNSFHHQAVKKVGPGLQITGISDDGITEGIELSDAEFVVGVQWHPEMMTERVAEQLKIFRALIDAAGKQ